MRRAGLLLALSLVGCPEAVAPPAEVPAWSQAFDAAELGWLLSVWGPSGDDLYAVGGRPEAGLIMHYDGARWSERAVGFAVPLLNWAYGFSSSDVYFAGAKGTILHWDGQRFTRSATVTDQDLWGVWGARPDDLWAVGGNGGGEEQRTILRYDGTRWRKVEVPVLMHPTVHAFFKVWGSGADDVYVVGMRGTVLHWDGTALRELFVGASEDLISVWGLGPDRVAIVGGRANGEIITYDGARWQRDSLAPLAGINGVWMRDPQVVHFAGEDGTLGRFDWSTRGYQLAEPLTRLSVHAVFGDSGGRLTAVGGSLLSIEPPFRGVALSRALAAGE